jgi:hypothetical protein
VQNHITKQRGKRSALLLLVSGIVIAAIVAAALPSQGLGRAGARDDRGFPTYYKDNRGLALRLCEDGTGRCLGASRGDLVPPEGEAFYWMATATIHSKRGPLDVEFALEAAFAGTRPIVFDRIRIRGHLNKKGAYILGHPYGANRFRAITPREQRNVDMTQDRSCHLRRQARCGGLIDNFLRARVAPKGYIGPGAARLTRVKGGTVRNSLILRTGNGKVIGRTSKFEIVGKRAGKLAR